MSKPFNKLNLKNLIAREKDIINMIKDILTVNLVSKNLTLTDAELEARNYIQDARLKALEDKPDIHRVFTYEHPFYLRIPKGNTYPIIIEFEGTDTGGNLISFGFKLPISFFDNIEHVPHVIYANKKAMSLLKGIHYNLNTTASTKINIFGIKVQNITSGTVSIITLNRAMFKFDPVIDQLPITMPDPDIPLRLEPDNDIIKIPNPELLVRSKTAKYIEYMTQSEYLLLVARDQVSDDTVYHTMYSKDNSDYVFTFTSKDEARTAIPRLYSQIPDKWDRVIIKFTDDVVNIDGLFEGMDHKTTPAQIQGAGIISAASLYKDSRIVSITNSLFLGLRNVENLDRAFYNCDNLVKVPSPNTLLASNNKLQSAQEMFANCDLLTVDPELSRFYILKPDATRFYPNFQGYISKERHIDPIASFPWSSHDPNKVYPSSYSILDWQFIDVDQFKRYYTNILPSITLPIADLTDLSTVTISITDKKIDNMFTGLNVVKLPKYVKAPNAITAIAFAKDNTTIVDTDVDYSNIFLYNNKLTNVTDAFAGTNLTRGFEFVGASDTIENYTRVFFNCLHIDATTLPRPWRWIGVSGYPDDIIGIDGYKNIPNLPGYVPIEWGGPETEPETGLVDKKSQLPVVHRMWKDTDSIIITFPKDVKPGDILEIALVDPNNRSVLMSKIVKRVIMHTNTPYIFGIGDITQDEHHILRNTDCIRIRFKEKSAEVQKIFSDYVYQTAYDKPTIAPAPQNDTAVLSLILKGVI